jgi:membrane-bound serine protease (ClpP class)
MRLILVLAALGLLPVSLAQSPQAPSSVIRISIRGSIDPGSSDYLKSAIKRAERDKASALLVELDTPGGLVSSVRDMAQAIDQSQVPVMIFVTPAGASATSAGALLMLASHVSAMVPGSNIGAAHPVAGGGEEIKGPAGEKAVNDVAAFARGLAELRGRNRELAAEIVSKSKSFTAAEAKSQGVIEYLANDPADLLTQAQGREVKLHGDLKTRLNTRGAVIIDQEMSLGQKVLHFLANPNVAAMLMSLAMLCLYVEITTPGLGVAGVVGGLALVVALIAFQLIPIQTGGVVLMLLGLGLFIAELFATTHGLLALGGTAAFILGAIWMVDANQSALSISILVWLPLALVLGGGGLGISWIAARLKGQSERARREMGGTGPMGLEGYKGIVESFEGLEGKGMIRGETWSIRSSSPLSKGMEFTVERVEGMTLWVRSVKIEGESR